MNRPTTVRVGHRHQISEPGCARQLLGISAGDRLLVDVQDGMLVLLPQPESYARAMTGLHSEIWEGIDAQAYIREERASLSGSPDSDSVSE